MAVFVGLDCGGSSTRVLAIDEGGKVLFRAQSGPANLLSTPEATILQSLKRSTEGCPPPDSACGCFAGLVDSKVRETALEYLRLVFPHARAIRAEADYVAALAACGPDTAACVISGTGSVVCSRVGGTVVKSGGRGPILGDPGSTSRIGCRALSLYLDDPAAFSERFSGSVHALFGTTAEPELVRRLYTAPSPAALLARLAEPAVLEAKTDPALRQILHEELFSLASLAVRHLRTHHVPAGKIGVAGGLWRIDQSLRYHFENNLREFMDLSTFALRKPPVEGAAMLAKEAMLVH